VILRNGGKNRDGGVNGLARYCNYTLTENVIHDLTSSLDPGSSYYSESRREKYNIYRMWLKDERGDSCITDVTIRRGEIVEEDTMVEILIKHTQGSVFACAEACKNQFGIHSMYMSRGTRCVISSNCADHPKASCSTYSFNWNKGRCRLSSLKNPKVDNYYDGYDALCAQRECQSPKLNQEVKLMAGENLYSVTQVCKFDVEQPHLTRRIYRSCPGTALGLEIDLMPVATALDRHLLKLQSTQKVGEEERGADIKLSAMATPKGKPGNRTRGREKRAIPGAMLLSSLKPYIMNFLTVGASRMTSVSATKFLGAAMPLSSILMLSGSILSMVVQLAVELLPTPYYSSHVDLEDRRDIEYASWNLIQSINLFQLVSTNPDCASKRLLEANNIPRALKALQKSLNVLQKPLNRILEDAQPLSQEVRTQLENSSYGYWTVYQPEKKQVMRTFVYAIHGGQGSAQRQVALLSGSRPSSILQGTVVAGSARLPGKQLPAWACVEYALEAHRNVSALPQACYSNDITALQNEEVFATPFLPGADLYKVYGVHRLDYSCPEAGIGTLPTRGLFVAVIGRSCSLAMDGHILRPAQAGVVTVWKKPRVLVDESATYAPSVNVKYPTPLVQVMSGITNRTMHPLLREIIVSQEEAEDARRIGEIAIAAGFPITAAMIMGIIYVLWRRTRTIMVDGTNGRMCTQIREERGQEVIQRMAEVIESSNM
jgi:hypothetical protein